MRVALELTLKGVPISEWLVAVGWIGQVSIKSGLGRKERRREGRRGGERTC